MEQAHICILMITSFATADCSRSLSFYNLLEQIATSSGTYMNLLPFLLTGIMCVCYSHPLHGAEDYTYTIAFVHRGTRTAALFVNKLTFLNLITFLSI